MFKSELEKFTWHMLLNAAGNDQELSNDELESYAKKNDVKIKNGLTEAMKSAKEEASKFNYIEFKEGKKRDRFNLTSEGMDELKNLIGLKKYLSEFTIINEREVKEIELWDDYLIVASIFGISDKVFKEFKKLVPDFMFAAESQNGTYRYGPNFNAIIFANSFRSSAGNGFNAAERARRNSGGGGFSSFGGGSSGFSGGGSGGGSR